ncbi:MAG: hypothetical protein DIZ80_16015 [endosymbiont of Galathealinum brachiosum]|uniref:Zinc finger/thioredoxin putative domain-containing protein n=1 Tax=endosymbiont of Galathealinum brachiosum TaxID=2200906 RepID=A0A370DA03_9GAMM|nr:MAG: hypothetical protein DIZ80_16015 [endosymbiont of Galathealinum brachiosum]
MQTECPHCNTVFRVKESELEQADGQVRCGHCLAIFTADNPYNAINYQTENNAVESPDINEEETDSSPDTQHIVADVIPPELRAESRKGKKRFGFIGTLILTLAILTGISAIFLQYAFYNRDKLVKIAELRPWLNILCQQTGCTLPPPKDRKLIILTSKNIFSHPNVENALMVSASIVNQADFAQDFPVIELRFENVRGKTIAGRRFNAVEYLGIPKEQISKMQPDISININLEIKDPGSDMVSYEFAFL